MFLVFFFPWILRKYAQCYLIVSALTAGSSQFSGPKCGMTISSPELFFVGLPYVHIVPLPSAASQIGLTTVRSVEERQLDENERQRMPHTLEPNLTSMNSFLEDDEVRRRSTVENG